MTFSHYFHLIIFLFLLCYFINFVYTYNGLKLARKILKGEAFRIVGGTRSAQGQFPSQVSFQRINYEHFCGGTLIDTKHVFTAGHCVFSHIGGPMNATHFLIMGGDVSVTLEEVGPYRIYRQAELIFVHLEFIANTHNNDVAIIRLRLEIPVLFNILSPAPLASEPFPSDTKCSIAGWGISHEKAKRSEPYQLFVEINIMAGFHCQRVYKNFKFGTMICAGVPWGGKDSCQGDSGGGLICNDTLAGVVGFGHGCGVARYPGVYANALVYRKWIRECINFNGTQEDIPMPPFTGSASTYFIKYNKFRGFIWILVQFFS